jgi:outer membrane lipoprotein SlyB
MGGTLKQLVLGLLGAASGGHGGKKKKERRQLRQTVELRVRMDCERCERQVRKALTDIRG